MASRKNSNASTPKVRDRPPAPGPSSPSGLRLALALAAGVLVLTCAVHWPVLSTQAVSINDGMYVTHNPLVLRPSWESVGRFLGEVRKPSTVQGYYQPLTMISLMLDTVLGGSAENLRPYHRTSLAIHAVNAGLLVVLLYMLLGEPWSAAFAGLLFGLHPMTVETMAWTGERKTLLATFFALLCLIAYVQYTRRPRRTLLLTSAALFLLALMSKPTVTPLPIVLLLLDHWPLRRLNGQALIEKLVFFVLAGVFAAITLVSQQHLDIAVHLPVTVAQHLMLICHNLVFYPLKMVWPVPVSSVYPFPDPIAVSHPMVLAGLIGTFLMGAVAAVAARRTRAVAVCGLIFLVTLAPTLLNIQYAMGVAADKYAYLPALGFLLLLAAMIGKLIQGQNSRKAIAAVVVLGLAVCETRLTRDYIRVWANTESLCRHVLTVAPDTEWIHSELANQLLSRNRIQEALEHASKALRIAPRSQNANSAMGQILMHQGRLDEAIKHFEQALAVKSDLAEARINLAICLASSQQLDKAIEQMEAALKDNPGLPEAQFNAGLMLDQRGLADRAATHYEEAIRQKPAYAEAHYRLADLLGRQGRSPQAIDHYRQALKSKPNEPAILTNLGIELARAGQLPEAISQLRRATELVPGRPDTHNNLAQALMQAGRIDEAMHAYRAALAVDPNDAKAKTGLEAALKMRVEATQPR